MLLMYPHGAPGVQCSSCRFVTEIGVRISCNNIIMLYFRYLIKQQINIGMYLYINVQAHNRRPPLSVQQTEVRAQSRRHRRFNRLR